MTSRDPAGPVAILAGSGELPLRLAERLMSGGREHRILAFRGFADRSVRARADAVVGLLDVKGAIARLESWAPGGVTLAGGVNRPGAAAVMDAFSAFRSRAELAQLLARGDDNLLRAVLRLLEERGYRVLGVAELAPDLLAQAGLYGACRPSPASEASVAVGLSLLDAVSDFDIGQAVIVRGERVVALEGPEGTDRMLARAASLRGGWFLRRPAGDGVLVKTAKRGQDLRVDLPAIGPRTVRMAARAGLAGIAVGAGQTIVLDRAGTVQAADRLGLFLAGMARPQPDAPRA